MSDDAKKPEPVYAPPEQTIIPGYKKYVASPPRDWRKWEDGHGNKIDSPPYQGQQFTGKIIPPLTDSHGHPIKEGSLQLVRDAKGTYRIIDWSLPVSRIERTENDEGRTLPIMGRCIYETRHSLERGKLALSILARKKKSATRGFRTIPCNARTSQAHLSLWASSSSRALLAESSWGVTRSSTRPKTSRLRGIGS